LGRYRSLFGIVLRVNGGTHDLEGLVGFAVGVKHPGGCHLLLDFDLIRPIAVLRFSKPVAHLGELGGVDLGGFGLAGARGAECPGKIGNCHGMREFTRLDLQICRAVPVATFQPCSVPARQPVKTRQQKRLDQDALPRCRLRRQVPPDPDQAADKRRQDNPARAADHQFPYWPWRLERMPYLQRLIPSNTDSRKICEGMCCAWGALGAIFA